jgi:hypothetical protein
MHTFLFNDPFAAFVRGLIYSSFPPFSTLSTPSTPWISFYLVCEAIGTVATPCLLCQPWVIVKMIVEKQMEYRLAGETEVFGYTMD